MMISIDLLRQTLDRRISRIEKYVEEGKPKNRFDKSLHQSAAISYLWQAWVIHNRAVITACLAGDLITEGGALSSPISGLSVDEQLYCAQQYAEGNSPKPGRRIKSHLSEPNWGDSAKMINICSKANFECSAYILNCFGLAVRLSDLQLCRNTCAHMTHGQLADFNRSRVRYSENAYLHPSDMMNWVDPVTKRRVWESWVGEMLGITELIATCKS